MGCHYLKVVGQDWCQRDSKTVTSLLYIQSKHKLKRCIFLAKSVFVQRFTTPCLSLMC